LPREVFFVFAGFATAFATGFNGVPAASALSFCFLVATGQPFPSSRFQSGACLVVAAGATGFDSLLEVSVISHHRFCGRSRMDGDVNPTTTAGLEMPLDRFTSCRVVMFDSRGSLGHQATSRSV
jgi:hypothetical protein